MAGEYKITVKNPARPDGDPIEVQPLGITENGKSFKAFLTKYEVERYKANPHLEVEPTKRRKSDLNDDDLAAYEAAASLEQAQELEEQALQAVVESTPVAGEESVAATEKEVI